MPENVHACHFSTVVVEVLLKRGWKIGPMSITCMNDAQENWQVIKRPCSLFNSLPSSLWITTFCLVSGMIMEIEKPFFSASYLKDKWGTYNWLKLSCRRECQWGSSFFFFCPQHEVLRHELLARCSGCSLSPAPTHPAKCNTSTKGWSTSSGRAIPSPD